MDTLALVEIVLTETDFLGDITDDNVVEVALGTLDDIVEGAADNEQVEEVRALLINARRKLLSDRAKEALEMLADARDAGDIDADFKPIPYPSYRSV